MTVKSHNPTRFLPILMALLIALGAATPAFGDEALLGPKALAARAQPLQYYRFFEDQKNFLLTRPQVLETLFLGLVELKGDPNRARYHIRTKVLGCPTGAPMTTACTMDQLYNERVRLGLKSLFEVSVNFTELKFKPQPQGDHRIRISWRQRIWEAPILDVDEFLAYLGAAPESPYYRIKPGVKQIVFNAVLDNHFDILIARRLAHDLLGLYKNIPTDMRDRIYFKATHANVAIEENLASLNLYLDAQAVRINNRTHPAVAPKRPR